MTLPRSPTTTLLHQALSARLAPFPVGLGRIPLNGSGAPAPLPYVVLLSLWETPGGPAFGDDMHSDPQWVYQVSLYATRGDQLDGMRDKVRATILDRAAGAYVTNLDTTQVRIMARDLDDDTGTEDEVGPAVPSTLRYRFWTTPADSTA